MEAPAPDVAIASEGPTVIAMPHSAETSVSPPRSSWLSRNLRNVIAVALTCIVCYLAIDGNQTAQAALVAAFSVLVGAIWGERSALKKPGQDA